MAWKRAGRQTFDTFARPLHGSRVLVSTGARTLERAEAVERWLADVRDRGDRLGVLQAIAERRITLRAAYGWGEADARAWIDRQAANARDVDVEPLLDQWADWRRQRAHGVASVTRYVVQIRKLFPESPWRRSLLTSQVIQARLDTLEVSDPTRNRYRAALSAFCRWLVRQGVLDANPARVAEGYKEHRGRMVFYDVADAKRIIAALPARYQGREALMVGTGADWSDTANLRAADIEGRTVRLRGHKTEWRNRTVRITEAWTLPYVRAALKGVAADELVFDGRHEAALLAHHKAVALLGLPDSTLHDWRHTYAVTALRRGETPQVVAHQLGHANAYLVLTRYGKHVPKESDYQTQKENGP